MLLRIVVNKKNGTNYSKTYEGPIAAVVENNYIRIIDINKNKILDLIELNDTVESYSIYNYN